MSSWADLDYLPGLNITTGFSNKAQNSHYYWSICFHNFSSVQSFLLPLFIVGRGMSPRSLCNMTYLSSTVSSSKSIQENNISQTFFTSS